MMVEREQHIRPRRGREENRPIFRRRENRNPREVAVVRNNNKPIANGREIARYRLTESELERALAAETDDITRKTIAGTISVIKRIPDSVLR